MVVSAVDFFLGVIKSHQYLTNFQSWYRGFGCETIHPTQEPDAYLALSYLIATVQSESK